MHLLDWVALFLRLFQHYPGKAARIKKKKKKNNNMRYITYINGHIRNSARPSMKKIVVFGKYRTKQNKTISNYHSFAKYMYCSSFQCKIGLLPRESCQNWQATRVTYENRCRFVNNNNMRQHKTKSKGRKKNYVYHKLSPAYVSHMTFCSLKCQLVHNTLHQRPYIFRVFAYTVEINMA